MAQPKARDIETITRDGFTVDGVSFDLGELTRSELLRISSRFGFGIDSRSTTDDLRNGVNESLERVIDHGETLTIGGFGRREESDPDSEGAEAEGYEFGRNESETDGEGDPTEAEGNGEGESDGESESESESESEGAEAEAVTDEVPDHFGRAVVDAIARHQTEVAELVGGNGSGNGSGHGRGDRPEPREGYDFGDEVAHACLPDVVDVFDVNSRGVYLVGPAGTGKSFIAQQCARILGVPFASLSCGQLPQDYKLEGYPDRNGWAVSDFVRLFDSRNDGGVFCLDEIDNSHPATLTVLNTALSNGYLFVNGERIDRHPEFRVVATANTYGSGPDAQYVGRSALDFATVNRFRRIEVGFDLNVERAQCEAFAYRWKIDLVTTQNWIATWATLRKNIDQGGFQITATSRGLTEGLALLGRGWTVSKILRSEFAEVNCSAYERITEGTF